MVDFGQGLATKDAVQMTIQSEFRRQGIDFALPKSRGEVRGGVNTAGQLGLRVSSRNRYETRDP